MISYDPLWRLMATTNPETGKGRRLNEIYDDPKNPNRHPPTGIRKGTIDRMKVGLAVSVDTVDRLCGYLGLQPGDLMEWRPGLQPVYIRREPVKMAAILDYDLRGLQQSAAALQIALDVAQTSGE